MSGFYSGGVNKGIGEGIQQATSNILNIYGMKQRMNVQQQQLDIQKQNSASYQKMMHYNLASRFERDFDATHWMSPNGTRPELSGAGQRARLGVDATMGTDPRYGQPGADALLDY